MAPDMKKEPVLDKTTSWGKTGRTNRGPRKGQNQRVRCFQGSCEELKGWVFDSTDSLGTTDLMQCAIVLPKPTQPEDSASQLDKDIYKEEEQEYVRGKNALERVAKQVNTIVWGQCSRPMNEKLKAALGFETKENDKEVVELFKVIKSTVFQFDNKCDIYVTTANMISCFWWFYQARDMANIVYFKKIRNLINVAEEHRATLGLYMDLLKIVAANPLASTDDKKAATKAKFFGRVFILKVYQFHCQKLKKEFHNGLNQG
eukprot:15136727-Ditylum_brightwellii.AAC.1